VSERGQSTVEWLGLVLLVALALAAVGWGIGMRPPGAGAAEAVATRLVCAVRLTEDCRAEPQLAPSHGAERAALLRAHAPAILYEDGMTAVPVDFRNCRADPCAVGAAEGKVAGSLAGNRIVAFTHAIDCRSGAIAETEAAGADCSGERRGRLYLQYWFYYPGSATAEGSTPLKPAIREVSAKLGKPSYHPDDWESYQVRIEPDGRRFARASSHHGYGYELGGTRLIPGWRFDARAGRWVRRPEVEEGSWGPDAGTLYVSGGSHAGSARIYKRVNRRSADGRLVLIPLRQAAKSDATEFAVTPPWRKRVYFDPEAESTG
jgi:hypothetical protein